MTEPSTSLNMTVDEMISLGNANIAFIEKMAKKAPAIMLNRQITVLAAALRQTGRPLIIDLYCGEGGAAKGYIKAGFNVIGIDTADHSKRYPGAFIRGDVLAITPKTLRLASAVHASPPCQFGSEITPEDARHRHVNLIPATRKLLNRAKLPYVIENVRGVRQHLIEPVSLFGTFFDDHMFTSTGQKFVLSRERLFETNWGFKAPLGFGPDLRNGNHPIANVYGGHLRARGGDLRTGGDTGRTIDFPGEDRPALARQLMGMSWASMKGMSEAVPPSYTLFVGAQLRHEIARTL